MALDVNKIIEICRQRDVAWLGCVDKLIHAYFKVDLKEVWRAAQNDLPTLKIEITRILNRMVSPENGEQK